MSGVGINGDSPNKTYSKGSITTEEIVNANIMCCYKSNIYVNDNRKTLSIIYWLHKMDKTSISSRFTVTSKSCSTKQLSNIVSKLFKMIYNHVENFHNKSQCLSSFKKFWVEQN